MLFIVQRLQVQTGDLWDQVVPVDEIMACMHFMCKFETRQSEFCAIIFTEHKEALDFTRPGFIIRVRSTEKLE